MEAGRSNARDGLEAIKPSMRFLFGGGIMQLVDSIKRFIKPRKVQEKPFKTLEEQIEAESQGWYDKHWALRRVMHRDKLHEIAKLNGLLEIAGVEKHDSKKPAELAMCEEAFAMFEYLIFNSPKIMDALLTMQINSLEGQLSIARNRAERILEATS
jgi:hypothetical protein